MKFTPVSSPPNQLPQTEPETCVKPATIAVDIQGVNVVFCDHDY